MNILVFSWRGPKHPFAGGAEQVMHEHMKGWVEAGHEVILFTSSFANAKSEQTIDGIKIIRRSFQYWGVHFAAFIYYLFGEHEKFDLVVDQFHGIPFFTPFYVKAPKLAVIQEVAREVWLNNYLPKPFNKIVGIIGYLGEPILFIFYRNITFMTGSDSAKEALVKMRVKRERVNVVPHGVLVTCPKPVPEKEKVATLVFLGTLAKDKGIEDAIKTFAYIKELGENDNPIVDFQFWVLGKGDPVYVAFLKKMVYKLGISESTKLWGHVTEKNKFKLLARSHLMINPSMLEGWGLVNIEANAMGTPVVAYTVPGLVDSVRDDVSGILINPNSPETMADIAYKLLCNKSKLQKLSKSSTLWASRFKWLESKKVSLELISKLTS